LYIDKFVIVNSADPFSMRAKVPFILALSNIFTMFASDFTLFGEHAIVKMLIKKKNPMYCFIYSISSSKLPLNTNKKPPIKGVF
jgi:hypothetical protein